MDQTDNSKVDIMDNLKQRGKQQVGGANRKVLLLSLGVLLSCVATGLFVIWLAHTPPDSFEHPPIYPGAEQVRDAIREGPSENYCGSKPCRVITFTTKDSSESVLSFYRGALQADRWELSSGSEPISDQLRFDWTTHEDFSSMCILTVTTKKVERGITEVMLEIGIIFGM